MQNAREVVVRAIQEYRNDSNGKIARLLIKENPELFQSIQQDTLRRWVSSVRRDENLESDVVHGRNPWMIQNGHPPAGTKVDGGAHPFSVRADERGQSVEQITATRVMSLEDLVTLFKIDLTKWKVKHWECSSYESHTKLRHYDTAERSKSGYPRVDDSHKVVPLYRVWARLEENRPLIELATVKEELMEEIKQYALRYPKIVYPANDPRPPCLFEVDIFDLHFGRLVWSEESGTSFDIKIARTLFISCVRQLIEQAKVYHIERIVFPVGNDFFNVDSKDNTTTDGTPQSEDSRWNKTFKRGRQLLVEAVDILRLVAPVDVVVVAGNHDVQRTFYVGDALECWYNSAHDVQIDNSPKLRKYYQYGKCLIGYTHGKYERAVDLPQIMASEVPQLWAATSFREWHLGHIHHRKEIKWVSTDEFQGTTVRYLRSITSTDAWHYRQGYVNTLRAGEGFIWDKEGGLVCQFTARI